jgi:hypothetical protein
VAVDGDDGVHAGRAEEAGPAQVAAHRAVLLDGLGEDAPQDAGGVVIHISGDGEDPGRGAGGRPLDVMGDDKNDPGGVGDGRREHIRGLPADLRHRRPGGPGRRRAGAARALEAVSGGHEHTPPVDE